MMKSTSIFLQITQKGSVKESSRSRYWSDASEVLANQHSAWFSNFITEICGSNKIIFIFKTDTWTVLNSECHIAQMTRDTLAIDASYLHPARMCVWVTAAGSDSALLVHLQCASVIS